MMARPVVHYLASFPVQEPVRPIEPDPAEPASPPQPPEPAPEHQDTLLQAACEAAFAEGMAAAKGDHDAALAQERGAAEARLAAERVAWAREESERLKEEIIRAFAEIEEKIASGTARVLRGFLAEAMRRKVVEALADDIRLLCADPSHKMIEISGPDDLLGELRDRLSGLSAAFEWRSTPSVDVTVIAGQTMIDSRLEAWLERLKSLPE